MFTVLRILGVSPEVDVDAMCNLIRRRFSMSAPVITNNRDGITFTVADAEDWNSHQIAIAEICEHIKGVMPGLGALAAEIEEKKGSGLFDSSANSEAGAWMGFVNQTISDWQDMADAIARAAQDVVANLAPEYQAMISAIAAAGHIYLDRLADAVELCNQSVSGAVAAATVQANAAALAATNAITGFARD